MKAVLLILIIGLGGIRIWEENLALDKLQRMHEAETWWRSDEFMPEEVVIDLHMDRTCGDWRGHNWSSTETRS